MSAFDPATIQLQREALAKTQRDLDRDQRLLDRQPEGSKSKMAMTLRERIAEGQRVAHDLRGLIAFMEALTEHAELRSVIEATAAANAAVAVGDVLDEHDPEPPVGTVVVLHDDEKWKRLDEPGEWHWAAEHQGYQAGVWRWRRVTFDGPVTVVEVPGESGAGR